MPISNGGVAPPPLIPEHLRPYLITPAAYLEQHKSENVGHLVVGTVVIGNNEWSAVRTRSRSCLRGSTIRGRSDQTSCLPLGSPLSSSPSSSSSFSSSPAQHPDRFFSPSISPRFSPSSSPASSPEHSPSSSKGRTWEEGVAVPTTAVSKEQQRQQHLSSPLPSRVVSHYNSNSLEMSQHQQPKKILLVQRSRHDYGGLCWEIPGGSCDPHDVSILEAAARELAEEAGLRVRRFVAVVDRQRHEWLDGGEIWRKLTFIVEAEALEDYDKDEDEDDDDFDDDVFVENQDTERRRPPPLKVRLNPEEHEDFIWASREDLLAGGLGSRTFTWIQDEQRLVILRAFDIIDELGS